MTQKTLKQVAEFNTASANYLNSNPGNTKFNYALHRVRSRTNDDETLFEEFNKKQKEHVARCQDIDVEFQSTDERGQLLYVTDPAGKIVKTADGSEMRQYTPDNQKNRNHAIREQNARWEKEANKLLAKTVEIKEFYAKPPKGLSFYQIDYFTGFVISPEDAEALTTFEDDKEEQPTETE